MSQKFTRRNLFKTGGSSLLASVFMVPSFTNESLASQNWVENLMNELYKLPEDVILSMMLFGEARGQKIQERAFMAFTPINRVKTNPELYGHTIKEAILKPRQYSCFNTNKDNIKNLRAVLDPVGHNPKSWSECQSIARLVLKGQVPKNYNLGQDHFHTRDMHPYPQWVRDMNTKITFKDFAHIFYVSG